MSRREAVEAALAEWRAAERLQAKASAGKREALTREVEQHRDDFQRLSAAHMVEWIDKLQEAESRRANATPSTPPFHQAARDAEAIAAEIWTPSGRATRTRRRLRPTSALRRNARRRDSARLIPLEP
jgi:hypothetical protein